MQIQHLNHALLSTPSPAPQDKPSSEPPKPLPPLKEKLRKKDSARQTELALKIKGSELLQRATQQQFIMAGAGIGLVTSVVQALRVPSRTTYTRADSPVSYELSWFGGWPGYQYYPGKELNIVEFEHGQRKKHTRVTMRHEGILPILSRLLNYPARKEVMHRYYNRAMLNDTTIREEKGGGYTVSKSVRDRHGKRLLFEMRHTPNGSPSTLLHYVNNGRDKHDLYPIGNDKSIWRYDGLNAVYIFKANQQGNVQYYDVAPNDENRKEFRVVVKPQASEKEAQSFHTHTQVFEKTIDHAGQVYLKALINTPPERVEMLEHPLAFRQLIPTDQEGSSLLETGFERLPRVLRNIQHFKHCSPQHLPEGMVRHYPWQEWIFKPLVLTAGLAVVADGLYELLFSVKSPFIHWLQTHVEYRETPEASGVLQRIKSENTRKVAYVKNTGSEQADSDISNALEVLSTLGVIR